MSKRRHLTPEQKVAIVREHLLDRVPIAALCDKHQIHATQFNGEPKAAATARGTVAIGLPLNAVKRVASRSNQANSKPA